MSRKSHRHGNVVPHTQRDVRVDERGSIVWEINIFADKVGEDLARFDGELVGSCSGGCYWDRAGSVCDAGRGGSVMVQTRRTFITPGIPVTASAAASRT